MSILNKKESIILFLGDVIIFVSSLTIALLLRYHSLPGQVFYDHLAPFSFLFLVWVIVFFIAGLYDRHTTILKGKLPSIVFNSQLANSLIAVLFFYFIPYFGITPKTNLFLTLLFSFILVLFWRRYGYRLASHRKRQNAILIASGFEARQLESEININPRYGMTVVATIEPRESGGKSFEEEIKEKVFSLDISFIIVDWRDPRIAPLLPHFYKLLFAKVQFADMHELYENMFDRIPLSLVKDDWILENITNDPKPGYDLGKRILDIGLGALLALASLVFYPFVALAIKLEDRGPVFILQDRVGQYGKIVRLIKFRTMTKNDGGSSLLHGSHASDNKVTKVGNFLRKSRIDEFPQFLNVVWGDISLIGPRPEFKKASLLYAADIPYYNIRNIIKPGLSGWAQINHDMHPHHALDKEETRNKLSYDLYYIKNRSFMLDVKIILRTIKILVSFAGK